MMKVLFPAIVMVLLSPHLFPQGIGDHVSPPVDIVFDSSGKIIGFPPAVIRRHTGINFRVKISHSFLDAERKILLRYLNETTSNLTKPDAVYTCFLGSDYAAFKSDLADAITFIKNDNFFKDRTTLENINSHKPKHIPLNEYLRTLVDSQFVIKVYNGSKLVWEERLSLDMENIDSKKEYVYFQGSRYFRGNAVKQLISSAVLRDQFTFRLLHHDPFSSTLTNWYNNEQQLASPHFDAVKKALNDIDNAANYSSNIPVIQKITTWFTDWLWYTKGELTIHPFNRKDANHIKTFKDKIDAAQASLDILLPQKAFVDSCIAQLKKRERNFPALTRLQQQSLALADQVRSDSADLTDNKKDLTANTTDIAKLSKVYLRYQGDLFTSITGHVNVMKQFDAATDYAPVYKHNRPPYPDRWSNERVTEMPENEKVILMVQNNPASVKLKFDEKRFDFDDKEEFTKQVYEQLQKIDFSAVTTGNLLTTSNFFEALTEPSKKFGGDNALNKTVNCAVNSYLHELLKILKATLQITEFPPAADLFYPNAVEGTTADYSTYISPATQFEAAYRDSITIKDITKSETGKDVGKSFIKVGALRQTQIAAGIAIVRTPVTTTSIDTAGNGFKVSSSDNASNAIVGFKIYPLKNYNRDNGIIPRYFFRRLSVFGGFDIIHPLNNFYLGGAYDIVPGLAFIVGNNYYKQTTYTIANNQVIDTKHRYANGGFFYSVTVNPILFTQIIKTFFK
jgi:hypothetical protein